MTIEIVPLEDFIKANFKTAIEFAKIHKVDVNTVYRWKKKGHMYARGNRSSYKLFEVHSSGGDQINLF